MYSVLKPISQLKSKHWHCLNYVLCFVEQVIRRSHLCLDIVNMYKKFKMLMLRVMYILKSTLLY